jgi:TRAP-type mannitol/chloroaromatic compound transport system permease small subunit
MKKLRWLWSLLDRLYLYCGYLAAFFMFLIFVVTVFQILGRYVGFNPRGLTDYVGYFMGASVFLAFAHTFNRGAHVRIELFLTALGKHRHWAEKFSFLVTSGVVVWLAYYSWWAIFWSYSMGDMSQGLDATPLWIPQLSMAFGLSVFALSVVDHTIRLFVTGQSGLSRSADAM